MLDGFRITVWLLNDTKWLKKRQEAFQAIGVKTIIRKDKQGREALFYVYKKDIPNDTKQN